MAKDVLHNEINRRIQKSSSPELNNFEARELALELAERSRGFREQIITRRGVVRREGDQKSDRLVREMFEQVQLCGCKIRKTVGDDESEIRKAWARIFGK